MSSVGEDRRIMNQDEQRTESLLFYSLTHAHYYQGRKRGVGRTSPFVSSLCVPPHLHRGRFLDRTPTQDHLFHGVTGWQIYHS